MGESGRMQVEDNRREDSSATAGPMCRPGLSLELTPHVTFLMGAAVILFLSFAMRSVGDDSVYFPGLAIPIPQTCTARIWFGIDCPGCGLTRAFIAISRGEFARAWRFNPASFLVYLLIAVQLPWQHIQLRRILSGRAAIQAAWVFVLPIAAAIGLMVQWIVRMFC
jgi:hypothetical protein